jgi:PhzF family phenazine biosynthesis protein
VLELPFYQIDAFTDSVFKGNPAAVVPLESWLPDHVLKAIAIENNLSETAFFVPQGDAFALRWFTVLEEIDLCGHATLASAFVIFNHLGFTGDTIHFITEKAGDLHVNRANNNKELTLDFPERVPEPLAKYPTELIAAIGGVKPQEVLLARDYVVVLDSEETVRAVIPNYEIMKTLNEPGKLLRVSITALGKDVDFVSRFFCAGDAMPEDPVTGSAHCHLVPYWANRLKKSVLSARQLSTRGGSLRCRLANGRVYMTGNAVTYLEGKIFIPNV